MTHHDTHRAPMSPTRRRRMLCVAAVAMAALCAVASCSTPDPSGSDGSGSALARYEQQSLTFVPCDRAATGVTDPRVECARLRVPLSYTDPDGRAIDLGVSRIRATSANRTGSVVVNPGGPGAPSLGFVTEVADSWAHGPAREHLDIVSMDPRGVGTSTPAIDCYTDSQRDDDAIVSGIPVGGLRWTASSVRSVLDQCAQRTGGTAVLQQMGTKNVARDLDVLRAVLGEDKLSFLGASYGTRLGTIYAQQFPRRVRAMVLDGAVDARKNTIERQRQLVSGQQRSFDDLARYCAQRPACPVGNNPSRATGAVQRLLQPLVSTPAPTAAGRPLSYYSAIEAITLGLYSSTAWDSVIAGLAQLQRGHGDVLLALRDASAQRGPRGAYTNSSEATLAINCLDEIQPTPEQTTAIVRQTRSLAPYMDPGIDVTTRYGCQGWPTTHQLDFPYGTGITGLPTLLVVSVTRDGLTPHDGGVALARALGAHLLTVDGDQHGATTAHNGCVNTIVEDYLVNVELPDGDPQCTL